VLPFFIIIEEEFRIQESEFRIKRKSYFIFLLLASEFWIPQKFSAAQNPDSGAGLSVSVTIGV